MHIRFLSKTPTTVTYGWTPPVGQRLIEIKRPDGVTKRIWSTTQDKYTFKKREDGMYLITVLGNLDFGGVEYPPNITDEGEK
jgi:hypothetical protein